MGVPVPRLGRCEERLSAPRFAFNLMPWHEVMNGAQTEQRRFIERGLAGVRERRS